MRICPNLAVACLLALPLFGQTGQIPPGFTPIFNGKDLSGWHISQTNHHGNTQAWRVEDSVLFASQDRPGNGGILLTDTRYKDVEVYLEIKPDWGCDGGLFLRSNERGQAYQVLIDYLERGNIGGIFGEKLNGLDRPGIPLHRAEGWEKVWRKEDWNTLRARIEGSPPHITVWLNGLKITDWKDTANRTADGAEDGMIALQVHMEKRWNGYHRFRNIAVKVLAPAR
ncbi:MAG: DUF1080 domain-containing protein [Acidobacteria bacterium]|nr:DUF1080 domain-containing protein [Acidobacteriota bacterium]